MIADSFTCGQHWRTATLAHTTFAHLGELGRLAAELTVAIALRAMAIPAAGSALRCKSLTDVSSTGLDTCPPWRTVASVWADTVDNLCPSGRTLPFGLSTGTGNRYTARFRPVLTVSVRNAPAAIPRSDSLRGGRLA